MFDLVLFFSSDTLSIPEHKTFSPDITLGNVHAINSEIVIAPRTCRRVIDTTQIEHPRCDKKFSPRSLVCVKIYVNILARSTSKITDKPPRPLRRFGSSTRTGIPFVFRWMVKEKRLSSTYELIITDLTFVEISLPHPVRAERFADY